MKRTVIFYLLCAIALFSSAQDMALADSIVKYQLPSGGWPKNQDWLRGADQAYMAECLRTGIGSTIDNGATTSELKVLAKVIRGLRKSMASSEIDSVAADRLYRYQHAFRSGVTYLLDMQYGNGGWPQFWPRRSDDSYSNHITFNDNAMVNVMRLLQDVAEMKRPYDLVDVPETLREACRDAFWKGVQCILDCQIKDAEGKPTVWCQQHDEVTLAPASARKYELAAYCGHGETVEIVSLLIEIEDRLSGQEEAAFKMRVHEAIDSAIAWLACHAIHNMKLESYINAEGKDDKRFVPLQGAPDIWARYYDLQTGRPLFSDRHGQPLDSFNDIGYERRNGYSWLGDSPRHVIEAWKKR